MRRNNSAKNAMLRVSTSTENGTDLPIANKNPPTAVPDRPPR
jgi:hypothetical protein